MPKYFQNVLPSNLCLSLGSVLLTSGEVRQFSDKMLEDAEILKAIGLNQLKEVNPEKPMSLAPVAEKPKIEVSVPYKGLTLDELKAEQAKRKAVEEPANETSMVVEELPSGVVGSRKAKTPKVTAPETPVETT